MSNKILGFAAAAGALALILATPAAAAVTLVFDPTNGSTENTGASATATFAFFDDAGGDVRIEISLANTTDGVGGNGATAATLVGVAFDLPSLTTAMVAGDYNANSTSFTKFWANPDFNPFTTPAWGNLAFDYGISPNRQTFAGGNPNTGVTAGNALGPVKLFADTTMTAAQFETAFLNGYTSGAFVAGARFQQVSGGTAGGSDKVLGGLATAAVPEPGMWALMILGFGGAGAMLRRRRAVAA